MAQENHDHGLHSHDSKAELGPLDRDLDAALAMYSAVEPRAGLEERVLATLQAERDQVMARSWRHWSFVSAAAIFAAVVIIVATLALRSGKAQAPVTARRPTTVLPVIVQAGQPNPRDVASSNSSEKNDLAQSSRAAERHAVHRAARAAAVANAQPKLDQFPSPQPLSEQEKILASYVEEYPERAGLLARARTEELRQDQLEEMKATFRWGTPATDSEGWNHNTTERSR